MVRQILYSLPIPRFSQMEDQEEKNRSVSARKEITGESPPVEDTGSEAGTKSLRGEYRGEFARDMAADMRRMFQSSVAEVPLFGYRIDNTRVQTERDGYYALRGFSKRIADPRLTTDSHFAVSLSVVFKGTRKTHWRSVRTSPSDPTTLAGNDLTMDVAVPDAAEKVRWFDTDAKTYEQASATGTKEAEQGTIRIYDGASSSYGSPTLIYSVPYDKEHELDVVVWDTKGLNKTNMTPNGDEYVQWNRIYSTDHIFEGDAVFDNGLARIRFDEDNNNMSAEEWDDGNTTWSSVSLGTSDWEPFDVDMLESKMMRAEAYVEFRDPTQNPTAYYPLVMSLQKGYDWPLWVVPPDEGDPIPPGLKTKLDPINDSQTKDPNPSKGLVSRKQVRK